MGKKEKIIEGLKNYVQLVHCATKSAHHAQNESILSFVSFKLIIIIVRPNNNHNGSARQSVPDFFPLTLGKPLIFKNAAFRMDFWGARDIKIIRFLSDFFCRTSRIRSPHRNAAFVGRRKIDKNWQGNFFVDLEKIITWVHIWGIARHTSFFDVDLKNSVKYCFFEKASCWFYISKRKASWKGWFKLILARDGRLARTTADCEVL